MDAAAIVAEEVRDLVRRRGIDPVRDPVGMRLLVEAAVRDYDERSMRERLPALAPEPVADAVEGRARAAGPAAGTVRRVLDEVAGFGPLQPYLDDPSVEEIWVNEPTKVFVARDGVAELTTTLLTSEEVRDLVERMLAGSGRRVDLSSPFVDATLPDGSRLHVVIPDVTRRHMAVNIRKFTPRAGRLEDLVRLGTLTSQAAQFLAAAVAAGLNVLVSGGTQAGKTTLLRCLLAAVPPRERVVTVEEVFELRPANRDCVELQCRPASLEGTGAVDLRRLVVESLRMRPDRLVVGEVRQAEALDLLIALNAGLPGMATVHANSAREALLKLCTLPLLAGENIGSRFVVPTVASSVDLVVHVALEVDGRRRVREIVAVPGRAEADVVETADLFVRRGGQLVRADGHPPHPDRFERVGADLSALLAG